MSMSSDSQSSALPDTGGTFEQSLAAAIVSKGAKEIGAQGLAAGWVAIDAPTVITHPGAYRVTGDFDAAGDGIVIQSSHVLLLLGNHTITGPGNKSGRGIVLSGVSNVLVMGGSLETFGTAIVLENTYRSSVRRISVSGGNEFADPPNGISPQIGVMLINSAENWIAQNSFDQVNLGIFVRGGGSYGNRIFRNDVVGGSNGLLAICYNPDGLGTPDGPTQDNVHHNWLSKFSTGIVTSAGSASNLFAQNTIEYFGNAWADHNGTNTFVRNQVTQILP
jgi:hypothetical protein